MKYSNLYEIPQSRDAISAFDGYNHNLRINESEFYDMENLTSEYYPCLSPRDKRATYCYTSGGTVTTPNKVNGIIAKDALCYAKGTKFYINNAEVTGLTLADTPKQLVSMGAYVIILPDKLYVNTKDTTDKGAIEKTFSYSGEETLTITYSLCNSDGEVYTGQTVQSSAPTEPQDGDLWLDTGEAVHVLKKWSATDMMWVNILQTFVKVSATGIADGFSKYDGVVFRGVEPAQLQDLNGKASVLYAAYHDSENTTNDYIVVTGIIDATTTQEATSQSDFSVSRKMPKMDFVIEAGNRLWGCRYGTNNNNDAVVNEIYASKLGDFKNWECYMGISTDSYTATVGTDGYFTGAITYLGYPLFFKEDCLHKVYGNYPSNYQIQQTSCRGVQKGAGNSLAIVNEKLYYKSRNGVCVYDGSLPYEISAAFGAVKYSAVDDRVTDTLRNGAAAGGHNNKYYISMRSEADGRWNLFVFDTLVGMWHREDNFRADCFAVARGDIYAVEHTTGEIVSLLGNGAKEAEDVKWRAVTGTQGTTLPNSRGGRSMTMSRKYVSRINVRMSLAIGARALFHIQYDSSGAWEHLATITGTTLNTFTTVLRPRRCDHFSLKIEGEGEAKIYAITKTIEEGSDI